MFVMAFREYRDFYIIDVHKERGVDIVPGEYIRIEMFTGIAMICSLGASACIRDSRQATRFVLAMCALGSAAVLATMSVDLIAPMPTSHWLTALGAGNYVAYAAYNSVLFERLIAFTLVESTLAFPMVLSDIAAYVGGDVAQDHWESQGG